MEKYNNKTQCMGTTKTDVALTKVKFNTHAYMQKEKSEP